MNSKHICPKCQREMILYDVGETKNDKRSTKTWDPGLTGRISSPKNNTSSYDISSTTGLASSSGHGRSHDCTATQPPEAFTEKTINLISYKCPGCGHVDSFRE